MTSSLLESPLDFEVGWTLSIFMWPFWGRDTFHFHVAFFGQTAPQLDREWHLAPASWPLSRFLHPCMWNDCLVRWDSRWG